MSNKEYPFGAALDEMDVEAFLNLRDWLGKALEKAGARRTGGGIGMGVADVDINLEGFNYTVTIKPWPRGAN